MVKEERDCSGTWCKLFQESGSLLGMQPLASCYLGLVLREKLEANVALYLHLGFWHTSDLILSEQGVRTVSKLCFPAHDRDIQRIFKYKSKKRWSRAGARITTLAEGPHGQEHMAVPTAVGSALRRN